MGYLGPCKFRGHFFNYFFTVNGLVPDSGKAGAGLFYCCIQNLDGQLAFYDRMSAKGEGEREFHNGGGLRNCF